MKLNKKVFAGALALAMGLGVVAPAANSFAADKDPEGQVGITEDYRKAEKAYVAALKALKEAESNLEKAKKAEADAKAKLVKATDALDEYNEKVGKLEKDVDLYEKELEDSLSKLKTHTGDYSLTAEYVNEHYKLDGRGHVVDNNGNIVYDTAKEDLIKKVIEAYKNLNDAKDALESYKKTYDALVDARDRARDHHEDTVKDLKLAQEKYDAAKEAYDEAKEAFIKEGANKNTIDLAEKNGIYVPEEDPEVDEDYYEKVEKLYKEVEKKVNALEFIKDNLKETYKRHHVVIDKALADAKESLAAAKEYLDNNKPMAFNLVSVAFASDEEGKDVLKDLEDTNDKLDKVLGDIEKDNEELNNEDENKDDENKDDKDDEEKPEDDKDNEEKPEDDKENEEKPDVEEKEDKKPSNNVKTGVAGVAGVGAVLAAASAAYVSSKRK